MRELELSKAFFLIEPGPVVLVTTHDGNKANIMTISWTMVLDFTPVFAITTGEWNYSYAALCQHRECLANIECTVIGIVDQHNIVDARKLDRRQVMAGKLPSGV